MVINRKVSLIAVFFTSLLLAGCGSKHIRKVNTYGLANKKHQIDEAELAKSFGVSYTVYSQETKLIKQYRRYKAKQGKGTVGETDFWLIARQANMLPSQLIEKFLDEEDEAAARQKP